MSRATEEQIELLRAHERWFVEAEDSTAVALRALLDERTELLKDLERLDWLESGMPTTLMRYSISDIGEVVQVGSCPATRRTLRDAIDAAVPKSEEKPK